MNVRFWHKADTQLTNNSFQCWWAGATSIEHTHSPMLEILHTPTSTLILAQKFFRNKICKHLNDGWLLLDCFGIDILFLL